MTTIELLTSVGAPAERVLDRARNIDLHQESQASRAEGAVAGRGRLQDRVSRMPNSAADDLRAIARLSALEACLIAARAGEGDAMTHGADKVWALLDAVDVLDGTGVPYALIGGVAVGLHSGVPRATLGTDLAVLSTHRPTSLVQSFVDAGFELRREYEHSVNFRHADGEPVQLAFDVAFDPMIARSSAFDVEGTSVRVVTKPDLVEMKRRAASDPSRRRSKALRDQGAPRLVVPECTGLEMTGARHRLRRA
jgi:hypothetical protein